MPTLRSFAPCRGFVDLAVSPRLTPWAIFFRSTSLNSDRSRIPTLMARTPPAVAFEPGRVRSRSARMSTIGTFYGILIRMFFNDHPPPHFHARYGEFEATVGIGALEVIEGQLPRRALNLVQEWR